jgi:PAS domain S-box-containing protein
MMIGVVLIFRDVTDQRRAEKELRASERELAEFFENATVGLHWVGPDGIILRANKAELDILGYSREEYVGRPVADFHADDDVICEILRRVKAGEKLAEYPARLRCKDGSIKDVLIDSSVLFRDGGFVHTRCFTRDVTERKRAETLLACQKRALEMVAEGESLPDVLDFLVRTIERESTTGVVAAIHLLDQTGNHFRQAIAPSLPESYHRATRIAVRPDLMPCCRAVTTCKPVAVPDVTGDPQWAAFAKFAVPLGLGSGWSTPIVSSEGRVLGTFANYYRQPGDPFPQDSRLVEIVTRTAALAIERVRAGDALRQSEQTARYLANASAALAVLVDFDSTLQKVASLAVPAFADWATVDLADGDGPLRRVAVAHSDPAKVELAHEVHRRFPPDPAAPQGVWNILRTGRGEIVPEITDDMLVQSVKDDGLLRTMRELGLKSYLGVPLKVRGKTLGVVTFIAAESGRRYDEADLATAQDLADRAAIAIENAQLYRELRDADQRKDEFLATLAHELRNPLAPIRNGLQVLRLADGGSEMANEARSMMERQLSQMVRLVDDLLDVSRITRNKLDLKKQRVTLAAVVQSAVETSRPLIEQSGHTLSLTLPSAPVYLAADLTRLAQVFSNLLNNSAKYTERGGRITLTSEVVGNEVVVGVRDNGLGMERAQGGLGIGLTLVRRLVEMHGGTVEARSDGPGRGSEFVVRLPVLKEVPQRSDDSVSAQGIAAGPARRILVVDDNQDSAMSLSMMLKLMGNETRTGHDGLAAVVAAEEFRPDLILLDIGLPKLNGYDACRRIREQPWSKGMVIVALTGWGQEEDRRRSKEARFDHHLVKPVEAAELNRLLDERKS